MPGKLKSRKLWLAVSSALFVVLSQGLDLDISQTAYMSIAGIVMSYLVAQGYVDAQGFGGDDD